MSPGRAVDVCFVRVGGIAKSNNSNPTIDKKGLSTHIHDGQIMSISLGRSDRGKREKGFPRYTGSTGNL